VAGACCCLPTRLASRLKCTAIHLLCFWYFVACSRVIFTFIFCSLATNASVTCGFSDVQCSKVSSVKNVIIFLYKHWFLCARSVDTFRVLCVAAKAIYDNKLLECYFTRSFYKHILGILVKYTDMESEDYSFYQGLVYLMEHHVSDLGYDLTFSAEVS